MTTPGALIAGRYRLRTRIASGGMGSVWEAQDEVLGRRVAVKLLLPQPGMTAADAETARNRVIREARITARLHHPHAVTIYDVVEHAGQPCLIMQYVPSRSLNAILQERGVLPEQMAARIGAELASALTAAHLAGIVHRDIKPSNVLITEDGSAKLTDFGISHAAGDVNLTSTGMVSGTPAYLAPEVARGAASGFPADVFSLGATLYATLEGAPPFGTDVNPMAILHRVASGQVILPQRSGSLTPLLLHMLTPVPGNRPTMAEVARTLTAAADDHRTAGEPDRPTTALPPPTARDWPAEAAGPVVSAGPPVSAVAAGSLSDSLLGARHLPDPPGTPPPITRRAPVSAGAPDRRRPLLIGGAAAVVLIALVALGIVLLTHRDGGGAVAATTDGSTAGAAPASAPASSSRSASAAPPPATVAGTSSSLPATRSSSSPARPAGAPTTKPSPTKTSPPKTSTSKSTSTAPTTSSSTSTSPTTSSSTTTSTSTSSSTSTSTSSSSSADTGAPTAGELAAAVTDYYAQLPSGTDDGWAHLTDNFRATVAKSRSAYQSFWDGVASVSVSNVRGTAPGTVRARVTYRLKDGRDSVEDTTYQLVRSDGILKIDTQQS